MTDLTPDASLDEAGLVEERLSLEDELDVDPADVVLEDDAWEADLSDMVDQRTPAPLDEED